MSRVMIRFLAVALVCAWAFPAAAERATSFGWDLTPQAEAALRKLSDKKKLSPKDHEKIGQWIGVMVTGRTPKAGFLPCHRGRVPVELIRAKLAERQIDVDRYLDALDPEGPCRSRGGARPDVALKHARKGELEQLRMWLDWGPDPSALDPSTLLEAVKSEKSSEAMVRMLLEIGVDANQRNPLETAVSYGRLPVISLLLEHGADPARLDSVLSYASDEAFALVADKGIRVDHETVLGALRSDRPERAAALIERVPASERDRELLKTAVDHSAARAVDLLLARGAPMDLELSAQPLFHAAASRGDPATVKVMLAHGADVNRKTPVENSLVATREGVAGRTVSGGDTPLHLAARGGHDEVVLVLLEAGADPNARLPVGSTRIANMTLVGVGDATPAQLARMLGKESTAAVIEAWVSARQ